MGVILFPRLEGSALSLKAMGDGKFHLEFHLNREDDSVPLGPSVGFSFLRDTNTHALLNTHSDCRVHVISPITKRLDNYTQQTTVVVVPMGHGKRKCARLREYHLGH
jgi:hypothetical protein